MAITAVQIRAARAILKWRQRDLADRAGVTPLTIKNVEQESVDPRDTTLLEIEKVLTAAGIVLVGETGVRLASEAGAS